MLVHNGHDPRDVAEYPAHDVLLYMTALPTILEHTNPMLGGG